MSGSARDTLNLGTNLLQHHALPSKLPLELKIYHFMPVLRSYIVLKDIDAEDVEGSPWAFPKLFACAWDGATAACKLMLLSYLI